MKNITLFFVLLFVAVAVYAIPAKKQTITHRQSDGTDVYLTLNGDEAFHYMATLDGVPVVKGVNGDYYYAMLDDADNLVATDCIAHNEGARGIKELCIIDANEFSGMRSAMRTIACKRAAKYAVSRAATVTTTGEVNVPVLLVEFSDVAFSFTKEEVSDFINKENYEGYDNPTAKSIGSAKDYFIAQSDGLFTPNFIVTDIITLPNTMAYYGANNASGNDVRPGQMIADGLSGADDDMDFSIFDNDGDGTVEFVYCIYAGYGENVTGNDENMIWPHKWQLSSNVGIKTHDGVKFDTYACSNEIALNETWTAYYGGKYMSGIGTMCHEFSHCLGLPDIYNTDSGESVVGYWDLMDSGAYNADGYIPIGYSAYERDFMGWRALETLTEKGDYSMTALTSGGNGYKIVNDANSNEYYVLENRQQEGWDRYVFNTGLLLWHIDYNESVWNAGTVNNTASHLRCVVVPADNELTMYDGTNGSAANAGFKGDVWPGTTGNTAFTDTSVPAATLFTGGTLGKPVNDITQKDGVVYFSFMRGVVDTPQTLPASNITNNAFRANWVAVDYAMEYNVELEKITQTSEGEGDAVVLLSEDFLGCSGSTTIIEELDDYMSVSGWTGSKLYSETGVIRIGGKLSAGTLKTPKLNYTGSVTVALSMKNYSDNDTGSVLTVSLVNSNGLAVSVEKFDATTSWEDKEVVFEPTGDFYIEFSTANSTDCKRVNLDDVVVSYKSSQTVCLVTQVSTENTYYDFTDLEGGCTYRYRVSANDGYASSEYSEYETVNVYSTSIGAIFTDGTGLCEVYTMSGLLIYSGEANSVPDLAPGVYIVKSGCVVKKVIVK